MKMFVALSLAALLAAFTGCSGASSAVNLGDADDAPILAEVVGEPTEPIQTAVVSEPTEPVPTTSATVSASPAPVVASAEPFAEPANLPDGKNTVRLIVCDDEVVFTKDTLVRDGKFYFAASDITPFLSSYDRFGGFGPSGGAAQAMPEIAIGSSLDEENGKLEFTAWAEVFTVPAALMEDEYMVSLDDVAAALQSAAIETDAETGYIRLSDALTKIDLSAYEGKAITVTMSGNPLRLEGQPCVVQGNEVYAPITGTFENLLGAGGSVGAPFTSAWDATTLTATINNSWNTVTIKAGELDFTANGAKKTAVAPLQQINGQYMLPLRSVAKALGAEVEWNAETGTLSVFYASTVRMSGRGNR